MFFEFFVQLETCIHKFPPQLQACLVKTYYFISKRTDEIYASEYKNTEPLNEHPKTAYWKKLIFLIILDIRMDKKFYDPVFRS